MIFQAPFRPAKLALWVGPVLWAAGGGCATRDRITYPPPVETTPRSRITVPPTDATVPESAGNLVMVAVFEAPLGLDTIYAEDTVSGSVFPPVVGAESPATVGYPFSTTGRSGDTIVLRVFATDLTGQRSDTAFRRVAIQ